jgi:DNA polymerase III subunit gamma/tau
VAYQVLARKWRPQTFEEVVGQQGVTQTLRNAIAAGRVAQAFVFAGARGVGKTTTARILAKALNCVQGPTADPCGACDACVEIAEGRNLDVMEIDAATHTQVDTVREVIIHGLAVRPARDRYKIFIIDEVHMLSNSSFNALLKSIEEPPPHVVFMMATTELHKIPDTIRSRSQEFEFRTIGTRAIAQQLTKIAQAEGIEVEPAALQLLARAAEGSLRDAESAFDQVIAFSGERITAGDVTTVLGLVGRDLLLDMMETVADEDGARVFDLASRAVESGQDLRLLCRELARLVRDMLVVLIDPSRLDDPDLAPEGDLQRLASASARFSREDLLRAFDVLSRAELDIRTSAQPRYHLEMALLKLIHLRKLVPLGDLLQGLESGRPAGPAPAAPSRALRSGPSAHPAPRPSPAAGPPRDGSLARRIERERAGREASGEPPTPGPAPPAPAAVPAGATTPAAAPETRAPSTHPPSDRVEPARPVTRGAPPALAEVRDALFDELRRTRKSFFGTVLAQAHAVALDRDTITIAFTPQARFLRQQLEQNRPMIEGIAERIAGRKVRIAAVEVEAPGAQSAAPAVDQDKEGLKVRAMEDSAVQAMLDVFPAEIRDVQKIEP